MKIKKILFVTKFEDLCYSALSSVLTLTKASLEHVVFLNVIERDKVAMRRGSGYMKEEEIRLKEIANIRFIDWAENLFEMGLEVGAYMEVGTLVPEILKVVEKEQPELVVIGRSHKGPLQQLYSRSDVTELTRRLQIPVLVFKHISEDNIVPEKIFRRPLLATSWSESSLRAEQYLMDMKNVVEELHVMHVISENKLTGSSSHDVQNERKTQRNKLDDLCGIFEKSGIDAQPHVYVGDAESEIEKAAREYQASLIILGTSRRHVLVERWMGSIPQSIADKSIYPCMLIPPVPDR